LAQVKDVIGLGSQATVKEGLEKKTKTKVAVKIYDVRSGMPLLPSTLSRAEPCVLPTQKGHREFEEVEVLREAYLMKKCEHPGILRCKHIFETKKTFELVVEYANVGEWLNTVRAELAAKALCAPGTAPQH
jgi:serine/threonine protein kinase